MHGCLLARTLKQARLLRHQREVTAVCVHVVGGNVLAVTQDATLVDIVKSVVHVNVSVLIVDMLPPFQSQGGIAPTFQEEK
jgi:hypothetical protein